MVKERRWEWRSPGGMHEARKDQKPKKKKNLHHYSAQKKLPREWVDLKPFFMRASPPKPQNPQPKSSGLRHVLKKYSGFLNMNMLRGERTHNSVSDFHRFS